MDFDAKNGTVRELVDAVRELERAARRAKLADVDAGMPRHEYDKAQDAYTAAEEAVCEALRKVDLAMERGWDAERTVEAVRRAVK